MDQPSLASLSSPLGLSAPSLPSLQFLDPNHVTRLAYVFHTAGDPGAANALVSDMAQHEIESFAQIKAAYPTLSREGIYLAEINAIIIGMANDITRRKKDYVRDLEAADSEYEAAYNRMVKGNMWSVILKGLYVVIKVICMGALGVFIAQTLAPFIPEAVAHKTGRAGPSFAMMTFFTLASYIVSYRMAEMSRMSIDTTRNWRKQEAVLKYDRGRLAAFRQNWTELVRLWRDYTGKPYEYTPFFEAVIAGELATDTDYIMQQRARQRSTVRNAYTTACKACSFAAVQARAAAGQVRVVRLNLMKGSMK